MRPEAREQVCLAQNSGGESLGLDAKELPGAGNPTHATYCKSNAFIVESRCHKGPSLSLSLWQVTELNPHKVIMRVKSENICEVLSAVPVGFRCSINTYPSEFIVVFVCT